MQVSYEPIIEYFIQKLICNYASTSTMDALKKKIKIKPFRWPAAGATAANTNAAKKSKRAIVGCRAELARIWDLARHLQMARKAVSS